MKKLFAIAALAIAGVVSSAPLVSAQTASAFFQYTPMNFTSAAPGSTITFRIDLVFTTGANPDPARGSIENAAGLSYWFTQRSGPSGNTLFPFSITNRDLAGSPWQVEQTMFGEPGEPSYPQQINAGPTVADFGAIGASRTASPQFVANITLQIAANATPGTYVIGNTISSTPNVGGRISRFNDNQGDTADISQSDLTIVIVPEPSTYALLAFAGIGAAVYVYRRRSLTA